MNSDMNKNRTVMAGLSCNLDTNLIQAAIPLFQENKVEAIEWSFDTLYGYEVIPDWFTELLHEFSNERRLIGHGVYFSMLSGKWSHDQDKWLVDLKKLCKTYHFDHISEHFGFLTGQDFHVGAPLPVPLSERELSIGQDRLMRLYDACQCPVGVENLAFSFTLDEVKRQGEFLENLIIPVNGFIILDLHNLYCQLHNFNLDFDTLVSLYPLSRVREIHISGGSWEPAYSGSNKKIRRDTHDSAVPEVIFDYLPQLISCCPNLKYVMLEQLGSALTLDASKVQFQKDFLRLSNLLEEHPVNSKNKILNSFLPAEFILADRPLENETLHLEQIQLSMILENCEGVLDAISKLHQSSLAKSDWKIEEWGEDMLETAIKIAKKWKMGFVS